MLACALMGLWLQHALVPYHFVLKTEAKSPHPEQATLIQDKRKAYEFLFLVKDGSPKPHSLLKVNWRRQNVLIIYPGLVQRDAKINLRNIKRFGKTVQVTLESHWGISAETYYPIYVITIPKQSKGLETRVYDPNKLHPNLRIQS